MSDTAPKVFISYRRDDAPGSTGRLYDRLAETFSTANVFMDVDAIVPGVDFVLALDDALKRCDVLLAIIGKNWLEARSDDGERRLDSAEDFVRIEIATALGHGIRVVPVLVDGAEMPPAADLPDVLKPLARRHAVELSHMRFAMDADRLARALALPNSETDARSPARAPEAPPVQEPPPPAESTSAPDPLTSETVDPQTPRVQDEQPGWSIGGRLDSFVRGQSPMTLWGLPVAAGISLIWASSFFGIDSIHAPAVDVEQGTFGQCSSQGKQVGLWTALNWSVVYLVLFPIFLILISFLARYLRRMIDECIDNGVLVRSDGGVPDRQAVHRELDRELAANNKLFLALIFVIIAISISSWWIASGRPLLDFDLGGQVVGWATVIIACGQQDLQYHLFGYTLIAYAWMGLALFVYLSCLFLGFIYASFLSRLAFSAAQDDGRGQTFRLIFRPKVFPRYLRDILFAYFLACSFGLLAGYFMRLEAGYLFTGHESLGGYWLQDLQWLLQKLNLTAATDTPLQTYQLATARNQTTTTGFFVSGITLVSFLGSGWLIYGAFQNSREFVLSERTKPQGSRLLPVRELTDEETREIESASFIPAAVPGIATMVVVISVILVGTVYPNSGFMVLSVTLLVLLKAAVQRGLRTWRLQGERGT